MSASLGWAAAFKKGAQPGLGPAHLYWDGNIPVEKFTNLPFILEADLFDTPENRVITSGWLSLRF
jgi:hypothetical protein